MIIECTLKREAPVVVSIGNETYKFALDDKGRNVAEVWLQPHIKAFLAVSHLYREATEGDAATAIAPAPAAPATATMSRKELTEALKDRDIKFAVTESNDALRAKLAAADAK